MRLEDAVEKWTRANPSAAAQGRSQTVDGAADPVVAAQVAAAAAEADRQKALREAFARSADAFNKANGF
jgi:hypothetical protein